MEQLEDELDLIVNEEHFSGAVRVDRAERVAFVKAYGLADRAFAVANTPDTQFAIASGTKGLTALVIISLIEEGRLTSETPVRSVLGEDLPLIDAAVTVEHLLSHRSGIGDYIDEDSDLDINDHLTPVPVHELETTEQYIRVLDGYPMKFAPGERFSYCNSGYVVLALISERVGGRPFHDLVDERVCIPAGMEDSGFLRSDELGSRPARGYLSADGLRTNIFHLPVRGSGDGGFYSTVADINRFWAALFAGGIVSSEWVKEMVRPRSDVPAHDMRYGLGFWLHGSGDAVILEGCDAGVSFRSVHDPTSDLTFTVVSNSHDGAWPMARHLQNVLLD